MNDWDRMSEICKGDVHALGFLRALHYIIDMWDNLIDKDVPVSDSDIHRTFWTAVFLLPRNPFYLKHAAELMPVMENGMFNWIAANSLEAGSKKDRDIAFSARFAVGDVYITVAKIINGIDYAMAHAAELKRLANQDRLEDYLAELEQKHGGPTE